MNENITSAKIIGGAIALSGPFAILTLPLQEGHELTEETVQFLMAMHVIGVFVWVLAALIQRTSRA